MRISLIHSAILLGCFSLHATEIIIPYLQDEADLGFVFPSEHLDHLRTFGSDWRFQHGSHRGLGALEVKGFGSESLQNLQYQYDGVPLTGIDSSLVSFYLMPELALDNQVWLPWQGGAAGEMRFNSPAVFQNQLAWSSNHDSNRNLFLSVGKNNAAGFSQKALPSFFKNTSMWFEAADESGLRHHSDHERYQARVQHAGENFKHWVQWSTATWEWPGSLTQKEAKENPESCGRCQDYSKTNTLLVSLEDNDAFNQILGVAMNHQFSANLERTSGYFGTHFEQDKKSFVWSLKKKEFLVEELKMSWDTYQLKTAFGDTKGKRVSLEPSWQRKISSKSMHWVLSVSPQLTWQNQNQAKSFRRILWHATLQMNLQPLFRGSKNVWTLSWHERIPTLNENSFTALHQDLKTQKNVSLDGITRWGSDSLWWEQHLYASLVWDELTYHPEVNNRFGLKGAHTNLSEVKRLGFRQTLGKEWGENIESSFYVKRDWAKTHKGEHVPGVSDWQLGGTVKSFWGDTAQVFCDLRYQGPYHAAADWTGRLAKIPESIDAALVLESLVWGGEFRLALEQRLQGALYTNPMLVNDELRVYPRERTEIKFRWLKRW